MDTLTVTDAYKSAAIAKSRRIFQKVLISWTKEYNEADFFTIGTSLIGGVDVIKGSSESVLEWDSYAFTDETDYILSIEVDRELTEPVYSVSKATCDIVLDNTSGRFTSGVDPVIGDYIKDKRPVRVSIGFDYGGKEYVQTFIGEIADYPIADEKNKTLTIHCQDFMRYIWEYNPIESEIYEGYAIEDLLSDYLENKLLLPASIYAIDATIDETVGYSYFPANSTLGEFLEKLAQAHMGIYLSDENGVYRFMSREHFVDTDYHIEEEENPHLTSKLTITDDMIISETKPNVNNIINVVTIKAKPRVVQDAQTVFTLAEGDYREIKAGETIEFFINYENPVTSITAPSAGGPLSNYIANSESDGLGTDKTAQVTITNWDDFSQASKVSFINNDAGTVYITELVINGTPAIMVPEQGVYVEVKDQDSINEYNEHTYNIENDYIQNATQAGLLARKIISDRKDLASYRQMVIVGQPFLQLGDLVTREDEDYRIIRIKSKLTSGDGLIQELTMNKRTIEAVS